MWVPPEEPGRNLSQPRPQEVTAVTASNGQRASAPTPGRWG